MSLRLFGGHVAAAVVCGSLVFLAISDRPAYGQVIVQWENPVDGNWFDADRWAGGTVPNGAGFSGVVNVDADAGGNTYEVTLGADANLVQLRIETRDASVLHTGGRLTAELVASADGNYVLQGGTITGAQIVSAGTFVNPGRFIIFTDQTSTLDGVSVAGSVFVGGSAATTGSSQPGNLVVLDGIRLLEAGAGLQFQSGGGNIALPGDQTVSGVSSGSQTSEIEFRQGNSATARIHADGGTLTIGPNVTVKTRSLGQSILGKEGEGLINRGRIEADFGPNALNIEGNWRNEGALVQRDGGVLNLGGRFETDDMGYWNASDQINVVGILDNRGETLDLTKNTGTGQGGSISLRGGTIIGGTIRTPGGSAGTFSSQASDAAAAVLEGVTIDGTAAVSLGLTRVAGGLTLTSGSSVRLLTTDAATPSELRFDGDQAIGGAGEIRFGQGESSMTATAGSTLTIGENTTVTTDGGSGSIGSQGANLINRGTIVTASPADALSLIGDQVVNENTIRLASGSIISIDAGAFTNNGTVTGEGDIRGTLVNQGVLSPGASPGLLIVDSLVQTADGTLDIEIGGVAPVTEFDILQVDSALQLAGLVDVDLIDGFVPQINDRFDILNWQQTPAFGDFAFNVDDAMLAEGLRWDFGDFTRDGSIVVAAIPEPTGVLLIGCGAVCLASRRLQKRYCGITV